MKKVIFLVLLLVASQINAQNYAVTKDGEIIEYDHLIVASLQQVNTAKANPDSTIYVGVPKKVGIKMDGLFHSLDSIQYTEAIILQDGKLSETLISPEGVLENRKVDKVIVFLWISILLVVLSIILKYKKLAILFLVGSFISLLQVFDYGYNPNFMVLAFLMAIAIIFILLDRVINRARLIHYWIYVGIYVLFTSVLLLLIYF